jgi:hypothetical protein
VPGPIAIRAALFGVVASGAAVAVTHLNNLPAFIVIAPGYLVQAWLFETHRALGGLGYQITVVGVSALVWTLIILGLALTGRLLRRLVLGLVNGGARESAHDS